MLKNKCLIGFAIVTIFCLQGCDSLYRLLDKEGAEEKDLVGEVVPFEVNHTIEEVQKLLKLYGINPGRVDGLLGLRTRNSIARFQKENGLKETRFVDQATWEKLSKFKKNGFVVDYDINVIMLQKALILAGFDVGKVDGVLGPKTKENVRKFQKAHALKEDGKVGYKTLEQLSRYLYEIEVLDENK